MASAGINTGFECEASDLTHCCRAVVGWCCGDVGPTLSSMGDGDGMRDSGMGEANTCSMFRGERGDIVGVTGRV